MKIKTLLLCALLLPFFVKAEYTIIEGTIKKPADDEVSVTVITDLLKNDKTIISTSVNEKGEFKLAFMPEKPLLVRFEHAFEQTMIYVSPGKRMKMSFEAEKMPATVVFQGDDANENNYLTAFRNKFDKEIEELSDNTKAKELSEYNFKKMVDNRKVEQLLFLKKYHLDKSLKTDFQAFAKGYIKYNWAVDRLEYAQQRKWKLHHSYYSFLHELPRQENKLKASAVYLSYLLKRVDYEYQRKKKMGLTKGKNSAVVKYNAAKQLWSGDLRYYVQAHILMTACLTEGVDDIREIYEDFTLYNSDRAYYSAVEKSYDLAVKFSNGSPAPPFELVDTEGQTVTLNDFRGKVVYMAFWASWCRPCLAQVKHVKELMKEVDSNEVEFIYVSIDEDEQAWQDKIVEKDMTGTQLLAQGGLKSMMAQDYNISGVPIYFMIDKEGNFTGKPPIPSAKEAVIERIEAQLSAD